MDAGASQPAFPRVDRRTLADDGDALHFCSTCAFSQACLSQGMDKSALMDLHVLVEHVGPFHAGEHIFREGDPFDAIAAVRAGTVKTNVVDRDGREHVLGFHLPGEVIVLLAGQIEESARGIIAACKLPPDADAALHGILVPLLQGAGALKADPHRLEPIAAMRAALADYARQFDDPGATPGR